MCHFVWVLPQNCNKNDYVSLYYKRVVFLSVYLEYPENHPHVIECHTLTPKDIRSSNIQQTTNPFDCMTLEREVLTVHGNELLLLLGQGIHLALTIYVAQLI